MLRHELCHAIDHLEDVTDDTDVFDSLIAEVRESPNHPFQTDVAGKDDKGARREAFANVCAFGPYALSPLMRTCDDNAPELIQEARFVAERVYSAPDAFLPGVLIEPPEVSASHRFDFEVSIWFAGGHLSTDGNTVGFTLFTTSIQPITRAFTVADGVETEFPLPYVPIDVPETPLPIGLVPYGPEIPYDARYDIAQSGNGTVYALAKVAAPQAREVPTGRLLIHRDDQWSMVLEKCPSTGATLFGGERGYLVDVLDDRTGVEWRSVE